MKTLFVSLFILLGLQSFAQPIPHRNLIPHQYIGNKGNYVRALNAIGSDSTLYLPINDTLSAVERTGALRQRSDGTVWKYNGVKWELFGMGGSGGTGTISTLNTTSINLSGDGTIPLQADLNVSTRQGNGVQSLDDGVYVPAIRNGLVWGGIVTWMSGYTYRVDKAGYYLNGVYYESPVSIVTLATSDPSFNRIDLFTVNSAGAVQVLTGTPSATPQEPSIDATSQIKLSLALVEAGTTQPSIVAQCLYKENTEWAGAASTTRFNLNSAVTPFGGTKVIEGTALVTFDYFTLTTSVFTPMSSYTVMSFQAKSKGQWGGNAKLVFQWYNGVTAVGNAVNFKGTSYGWSSALAAYQQVNIPLTDFGLTSTQQVTTLRITASGTNGAIGLFMDDICIQGQPTPSYNVPITLRNGLTQDLVGNVGELGGTLLHNTTNYTGYYTHTLSGITVYDYPYQFYQGQTFGNGTGVTSFLHRGASQNTSADWNNTVRLGVNYTSDDYGSSIPGYLGDRIGYMLSTNVTGNGSYGLRLDDVNSKISGVFLHTKDNSTDAVTIFGAAAPGTGPYYTGLSGNKIATFHNNKDVQLWGYPSTRNDGAVVSGTTKLVYVDATGKLKVGTATFGTGGGTYTAGNGLFLASGAFNLGGSLNQNTNINAGGFNMQWTGARTIGSVWYISNTDPSVIGDGLNVSANGGNALNVNANAGTGLTSNTTTGIAVRAASNSNTALYATTRAGALAGRFSTQAASDGVVVPVLSLEVEPATTDVVGQGGSIDLWNTAFGGNYKAGSLDWLTQDVTGGSDFRVNLYNSNDDLINETLRSKMTGQLKLPKYVSSSSFTGTAVANLGVTSSGDVITVPTTSGGLSAITANNGLTANTTSNVQLGGSLIQNTDIVLGANYLTLSGGTHGTQSLKVTNTNAGIAVFGQSATGPAGQFNNTGAGSPALQAYASGGAPAATLSAGPSSTNSIVTILNLGRGSSGTPANGIGSSINYNIATTSNANGQVSNQLISKWTDATDVTRTSQFEIWGVNSAVVARKFAISGDGSTYLDGYTGTTQRLGSIKADGKFSAPAQLTWDTTAKNLDVLGSTYVHKTGNVVTTGTYAGGVSNTITWPTANFGQTNGYAYDAGSVFLENSYGADQTLNGATIHSALISISRLGATANATINVNPGASKRAISANAVGIQLAEQSVGVVSSINHVAGLQVYAPQSINSGSANIMAVTNYYGLLLADAREYSNVSTKITNSYGVYQAGALDLNMFIGKTYMGQSAGSPSPSAYLDLGGTTGYDQLRLRTLYTPTGSADTNGAVGTVTWDGTYIYWKTASGWLRAAGSTF